MIDLAILFVLSILILLNLYVIRKLNKLKYYYKKRTYQLKKKFKFELDNHFSQIECFINLHKDLSFTKSLPPTRNWAGSPDFLLRISQYTLKEKPETIVECSSGVSTIVLAKCLEKCGKGHVYSLDHDPKYAQKTRDELFSHGLDKWATVFDAPLCNHEINGTEWLWYSIEKLPTNLDIDLLVIDGPPAKSGSMARYPAAPILFDKLSEKSSVFLDDSLRLEEQLILKKWLLEWTNLEQNELFCEKGCSQLLRHRNGDLS